MDNVELAAWEHELRGAHGEWVSVANTSGARAEIGRQLDAQGLEPDNPLRGVLQYGIPGNRLIMHRDPDTGHINAGIRYSHQKRQRTQTSDIVIDDVRVLPKRQGIGSRMLRELVRAHPAAKDMAVYGALDDAKPWYAKNGATFVPWSSVGHWDKAAVKALRESDHQAPQMASTITDQVLDFGWKDAWLHERRDAHGRWTRGGGSTEALTGEAYPGQFVQQILKAWRSAVIPEVKDHLNKAEAYYDNEKYEDAVKEIRAAARAYTAAGDGARSFNLRVLAANIESFSIGEAADIRASGKLIALAKDAVPAMFGKHETLAWDGKDPTLFDGEYEAPGLIADINWNGHVRVLDTVARQVREAMAGGVSAPVRSPAAFSVLLHEMIHGVVPEGEDRISNGDKDAYQTDAYQRIEEGFTELGTIQHAPEFFDKIGVGGRETPMLTVSEDGQTMLNPDWVLRVSRFADELKMKQAELDADGRPPQAQAARHLLDMIRRLQDHPENIADMSFEDSFAGALSEVQHLGDHALAEWAMSMKKKGLGLQNMSADKHATMSEYAQRVNDPERIRGGNAWGRYAPQTRDAYNWVALIARDRAGTEDPALVRRLSDEINAQGTAAKPMIMAKQAMQAAGVDVSKLTDSQFKDVLASTMAEIVASWAAYTPQEVAVKAEYTARKAEAVARNAALAAMGEQAS